MSFSSAGSNSRDITNGVRTVYSVVFLKKLPFFTEPYASTREFSRKLSREHLAAEIQNFQRSKNQKTEIYKNLEVIGILKTSEKAKSNSVYPTLLRGKKCLSYKIGEK